MINMTEVVNISYMFTVCQNEQSAFTCIAPFNSLNLRDKLSYYPHCPYSLHHLSKVTQQVFLIPKPLSPFCFPGFYLYLLILLSHLSMRDCCLKSQSWGVTSVSCWQIIERSQKLSNPSSIQSRHHSPVHKSIKICDKASLISLIWYSTTIWCDPVCLLNFKPTDFFNLFVDSHFVVSLIKCSSSPPCSHPFFLSVLTLLFPLHLLMGRNLLFLPLISLSHPHQPSQTPTLDPRHMIVLCLVCRFSWKSIITVRLVGP